MNGRGRTAPFWGFVGSLSVLILGTIGLVSLGSEEASAKGPGRPLTWNWVVSKPVMIPSTVARGENVEFLSLQKLAPLPNGRVHSPANIVFFDIPKAPSERGRSTIPGLVEDLRRGLGLRAWRTRNYGDSARVFEAYWEGGGRMVRVFATEDAKRLRYSIAMVRPGYARPVYLESELLQRRHIAGKNLRFAARDSSLLERLVAHAAESWVPAALAAGGGGSGGTGSASVSGVIGAASAYASSSAGSAGVVVAGTVDSATMTDEQLKELMDSIDSASATWGPIVSEGTAALKEESAAWRAESAAWRDLMGQYSDQVDQIEGDVLKRVDSALALGDRALDLAEKVTNPKYAALVGAAGAAGAAIGGFAVNAALDGLVAGGKALIELIKDSKNKEERLSRFIQAREFWEKTSPIAAQAEKQLDLMLSILETSAEKGLDRKAMKAATLGLIFQKQEDLGRLKKQLDAADAACSTVALREEYSRLSEELLPMVRVLCVVDPDSVPGLRIDDTLPQAICDEGASSAFDQVCSDSFNAYAKLAQLESQLQTAREAMRAGSAEYLKQVNDEMKKNDRSHHWAEPQSKKAEKIARSTGLATVESLRKDVEEKYRRQKNAYVSGCTSRCRVTVRSEPVYTTTTADGVPEACAQDVEIMLIRCQVPPEVSASVQGAVADCHSKEECIARVAALFDSKDKLQSACSEDVAAKVGRCTRDKVRSTVETETALVCLPAGESNSQIAPASQQAPLKEACEEEFMRQPGAGEAYADEMRRIDRAAIGVSDAMGDVRASNVAIGENARLRDADVALNPLLSALQILDQVNKEFLASDSSKLPELAAKGERLKAACEKVGKKR